MDTRDSNLAPRVDALCAREADSREKCDFIVGGPVAFGSSLAAWICSRSISKVSYNDRGLTPAYHKRIEADMIKLSIVSESP